MSIYRVEDTAYVDTFAVPSIFDPKLSLYKEWHDFVFFDPQKRVFGLLNFGVHGNPYDSKRGSGSALLFFVDPHGKILTETELVPLSQLQFSPYDPDFVSDLFAVKYSKDFFKVDGQIGKIAFNLDFHVDSPPVSSKEIFLEVMTKHQPVSVEMISAAQEITRQWDHWIQVPKLSVSGKIKLKERTFPIETQNAFHDHEGGRFDWDNLWGWDDGVLFCGESKRNALESASFMFYRYGPSDKSSHGGIFIQPKNGAKRYFDSKSVRKTTSGQFSGELIVLPGITRLLYPDYNPAIPQEIVYTASVGSDRFTITFVPMAVCSIVNASLSDAAEVVFNEMYCSATLVGCIDGKSYENVFPCWFESVRPRRHVKSYAVTT